MATSFIILGSGQDGGAPQVGQASSVSHRRSASSVCIVSNEGMVLLLDASPDVRQQSLALLESTVYPSDRTSLVDGICITHAHMGHYAGLLHFGTEAAATEHVPLIGTSRFLEFFSANEPWADLIRSGHVDATLIGNDTMMIDDILGLNAIAVPHRGEHTDTVAYSVSIRDTPWLLYVPDVDDWTRWPEAETEIARHDFALVDATFSSIDELQGRNIGRIPHPLVPDTISRFRHLTAGTQIILTHINHSNPLGRFESPITGQALVAGFKIAHDGFAGSDGS
jgi:pyrroloquinoline quinone biosynthesis protein B